MHISMSSVSRAFAFGVLGTATFAVAAVALGGRAMLAIWGQALVVGGIVFTGRLLRDRIARNGKALLIQTVVVWTLAIGVPVSLLLLFK
jgi:hypothetical protein